MLNLTLTEKGGDSKQLAFDKDEVTIGRVQGNDVVLAKGNVSKRHCRIAFQDGTYIVEDLKSTNGTYINGRKITDATTITGADKVYVGDFIVKVEMAGGAEMAAPPPAEAGSLSTALPRKQPPPPPSRPSAAMRAIPEAGMDLGMASSPFSTPLASSALTPPPPPKGRPLVPPPPPPRRETGKALGLPLGLDDEPLGPPSTASGPPPSAADVDMDDERPTNRPPRLNVPPMNAVLSLSDDEPEPEEKLVKPERHAKPDRQDKADRADRHEKSQNRGEKKDREEAITASRDKGVVTGMTAPGGPSWLKQLWASSGTTAVYVDGASRVQIEREGRRETAPVGPGDEVTLAETIRTLAAGGIPAPAGDASVVDVILPDGVRVTALFPPLSSQLTATFQRGIAPAGWDGLAGDGPAAADLKTVIDAVVRNRRSVIVTGDRGAATAAMRGLLAALPLTARVITLADGMALPSGASGWTRLAADPLGGSPIAALSALRPDHLVVEVTSAAVAADLLHEGALGLDGVLTLLPGRSAADALNRLQALAGPTLGVNTNLRDLVAASIDLVVHAATLADGSVRVVEVAEPVVEPGGQLGTRALFLWRKEDGRLESTRTPSRLAVTLTARGEEIPRSLSLA